LKRGGLWTFLRRSTGESVPLHCSKCGSQITVGGEVNPNGGEVRRGG